MAVPPVIEVSHSAPDLWRWFINLPWVRFITRRPVSQVPSLEEMGTPDAEFIDWQNEKKGMVDSQSGFVAEQPRLGKTQNPDGSKGATEYGQSQIFHTHAPSPPPFLHSTHVIQPRTFSHGGAVILKWIPDVVPPFFFPIKIIYFVCRLR